MRMHTCSAFFFLSFPKSNIFFAKCSDTYVSKYSSTPHQTEPPALSLSLSPRLQDGVVLVHCNAGVSRSSSIVMAYLMWREGLLFDEAYRQVKLARPSSRPNSGFYRQLQNYRP